ncbi:MAG TPA: GNAT family N-acetyltransferase [Bacilli bacterium]|nr:GNAT family N-acetyltransferase [Bacilli bacterium]
MPQPRKPRRSARSRKAGKFGKSSKQSKTFFPQKKGLSLRPYQPQDEPFLIALTLDQMKAVYESSVGEELTPELVRMQLRDCETTVIEWDGRPVGYSAMMSYGQGRQYWGALVLSEEAQGKGVGQQLVQHVVQQAKQQGVRWVDGHVQTDNRKALRFWLRNGFQIVGRPQAGSFPISRRVV